MGTLKKIIFQLDLHQRVLITLILPQCLSTQTIPLSPNIGFWIPLSVFKLSTQYPYYSQFFEYSVKNTLIDHTLIDHNACTCKVAHLALDEQLVFELSLDGVFEVWVNVGDVVTTPRSVEGIHAAGKETATEATLPAESSSDACSQTNKA